MSERITKINSNIRKYIDEYILKNVELPPDIFITISRAETTRDLKHLKVFVTIIPDNKRGTGLSLLSKHKKKIQKYLSVFLFQKFIPEIHFEIDEREAFGQEIDRLLDEIKDKK